MFHYVNITIIANKYELIKLDSHFTHNHIPTQRIYIYNILLFTRFNNIFNLIFDI